MEKQIITQLGGRIMEKYGRIDTETLTNVTFNDDELKACDDYFAFVENPARLVRKIYANSTMSGGAKKKPKKKYTTKRIEKIDHQKIACQTKTLAEAEKELAKKRKNLKPKN